MNATWRSDWPTVIAGFGSPHGDDQAGWRVAAILGRRDDLPARVIVVHEPTQVLEALQNCERLIIVDACKSGGSIGTITRLKWPDPRVAIAHRHSTHGVSVSDILRLAEKLDNLPPSVEIFGIEAGDRALGQDLSPNVVRAVSEVAEQIVARIREVTHA